MGTSTSWEQLTAKLNGLAGDYADLPKAQVREASLLTKKSVQTFMPGRLRGVGRAGAKLNVRYDLNDQSGEDASSTVYVTGPAQLVENDTRAHRIPRQRTRGRRRYAVIPGVGVRAYANHPGTRGKHPWAKGVEAAIPGIRRIFETTSEVALRRWF